MTKELKYQKRLYYSVQNGGDGSAYPRLMESKEMAELDQEIMEEGWGEDCSGWFTVESDSPISIVDKVETVDERIKAVEEQLNEDYMKKYRAEGKYPDWFKRLERELEAFKKLKQKQEISK